MRSSDWSSDVCSSDLFSQAAGPWIGDEQDHEQLDIFRVIERAHAAVAERYPKASPADMAAARRLLVLSLEWSDTLGVGHRNFEEFLAKTRTVIAGTCVGLGQSRILLAAGSFALGRASCRERVCHVV